MAKASDNAFPSVLLVEQASGPTTPAAGQARLYRKTDNKLYVKDDGGTETEVGSGSSVTFSGCSLSKSAAQSISAGAEVAVTFDGEVFDTGTYHDNSTNTSRITVPTTGYYMFGGSVLFASVASAKALALTLKKNGTTTLHQGYAQISTGLSGNHGLGISTLLYLTAGDYVELMAFNGDTSARNVSTTGPSFWCSRVA